MWDYYGKQHVNRVETTERSVMEIMKRTAKRKLNAIFLFLAMIACAVPQSQAAFNTNITSLITDATEFFSNSIIPWVVLVAGVVIVSGLVMKFRKGPAR